MGDVGNVDRLYTEHGLRILHPQLDCGCSERGVRHRTSPRGGLKTTEYQEKGWNPRAEDFDHDEAPFLRDTEYPAKA
jgi:hypothetical protein